MPENLWVCFHKHVWKLSDVSAVREVCWFRWCHLHIKAPIISLVQTQAPENVLNNPEPQQRTSFWIISLKTSSKIQRSPLHGQEAESETFPTPRSLNLVCAFPDFGDAPRGPGDYCHSQPRYYGITVRQSDSWSCPDNYSAAWMSVETLLYRNLSPSGAGRRGSGGR